MEFTRQRRKNTSIKEKYIVRSHVSMGKRILSVLISMIGYAYMLIICAFFGSACIDYNNDWLRVLKLALKTTNEEIRQLILLTVLIFIGSFAILLAWKMYNKLRYGKLRRRKMPLPTSDEEMLAVGLIESDVYYRLRMQKVNILEKSPIKEL